MANLFLKRAIAERNQRVHEYKEIKLLGKYCQEDAIAASKQLLATPLGLFRSFSAGAFKGWRDDDPHKAHRRRKAVWRFARMWMQQTML